MPLVVPSVSPPVIWVECAGHQIGFLCGENRASPKSFRCQPPVSVACSLNLPANAISHLEPITQVVREAASFRLSTAQRADHTDHLGCTFPQERRPTLSHCVTEPLAQHNDESNLDIILGFAAALGLLSALWRRLYSLGRQLCCVYAFVTPLGV